MNFDIARKAVDEYIQVYKMKGLYGYRRKPSIAFFGGEPFLEFDLIKEVINYCNSKNYSVEYLATTNGTIMNDEIIKYITDNDFTVTFSVDGDREEHDRNRVFAGGKESFDVIYSNILKLQNYKQKIGQQQQIMFSITSDNYSNLVKITDFFAKESQVFEPFSLNFATVNKFETSYFDYCEELYNAGIIKNSPDTYKESFNTLIEKFKERDKLPAEQKKVLELMFTSLFVLHRRLKGQVSYYTGTCMPANKIAVSPDGNYYVCERINQKYKIGDVDSGLDWDRCNQLFYEYSRIIKDNCSECSVSRLCDLCYAHLVRDEETLEFNSFECESKKVGFPKLLEFLFTLLEENNDLSSSDTFFHQNA